MKVDHIYKQTVDKREFPVIVGVWLLWGDVHADMRKRVSSP